MTPADSPNGDDWLPRRPVLWSAGIAAIATMLLAWPALGGRFLVGTDSDQYIAGYAFRDFAAQSLRSGHGFPLWNPFQFGGMPYVAAMHGDIFYPTFLLRLLLPTDIAMTWGFVLHVALAGVFTVAFLRAAGLRFASANIGGVAYLLSGAIASYPSPGHDGKLFVSSLLPAALWAVLRAVRDRSRAAWGALALVVGLAVLSPHPQLLQYMLLTVAAYTLFLLARPRAVPPDTTAAGSSAALSADGSRSPPRVLVAALGAVCVGALIGAVQYLPVREYVAWSPRAGGKGYDYATSFSMPIEESINFYLPQFSGLLDHYWGRNGIHFHSEYLGASVLVLALAAFGGGLLNRQRTHAWFWLGTFVVALFWAWGGNTPFYQLVYAIAPGAKYFRAPSTMLYVAAFASAVLAAVGSERMLVARIRPPLLIGSAIAAVVIALLASAGAFTSFALNLLPERADEIQANATAVIIGAWRSAFFALAMIAACWWRQQQRLTVWRASWAMLAIVVIDLWSVERHYWTFSARASSLYASDAIIDFLKNRPQPSRVIALPLTANMAPHDPFISGDALMVHRIRGVLGYHGNELGRFQELYGKDDAYQSVANPNFWALTNADFFYTNSNALPFPGARLVAGPVRNAAGTMTYLFQLPGEHPAAWIAPLIVALEDAQSKATLLNPNFDVRRVAIFAPGAHVTAKPPATPLPEPVTVSVKTTRLEPGAIDLVVEQDVPPGSALVVSENYYPGWQASVDGRSVPTERVDYSLIGIELPKGARHISLRFSSSPYLVGRTVSLLALATAFLMLIGGAVVDRRRATGMST